MKNQDEIKPKNKQSIHKKGSSYGGYGGNSSANMDGAINEFEDNLTVDLSNDSENAEETLSETNRLDKENDPDNTSGKENDDLNKKRAKGFDRIKKDPKISIKSGIQKEN